MSRILEVGYEHEGLREEAEVLAKQLHFTLNKNANSCLFLAGDKLSLKIPGFSLIYPELSAEFWNKRKLEGKKQGLVRACKPRAGIKIIDATAGWARDSSILASFGADVVMVERHPVMAALLANALLRSGEERVRMHLSLHRGDAYAFLDSLNEQDYPDVIYIDPMHPERSKSALVKKEMQILQYMIGVDDDALRLIQLAIARVKQRVVVKWPQKVKPLLLPDAVIDGKTVRFDIYFSNRMSPYKTLIF